MVIVLAAFDVLPIVQLALLAAGIMVAARVLSVSEARNAIDLDVVLLIAAAFAVGAGRRGGAADRALGGGWRRDSIRARSRLRSQ